MANGNWLHASHQSFFLTGETRLFNYYSLPLSPPILYSLQCDKPPFTSLSHHPSQSSSSFKDSLLKHWTKPRDVCHFTILSFSEFPHSFRGAYPLFSLTQLPSQWYNPSIINKCDFLSLVSQNSINNNFFRTRSFLVLLSPSSSSSNWFSMICVFFDLLRRWRISAPHSFWSIYVIIIFPIQSVNCLFLCFMFIFRFSFCKCLSCCLDIENVKESGNQADIRGNAAKITVPFLCILVHSCGTHF